MAGCEAVYQPDEEIKQILEEKDAQNTEKTAIRTFQSFIRDLETAEKSLQNLDKSLARFFANAMLCKHSGTVSEGII